MESIWSKTCEIPERLPLDGDIEAEAVVIGGRNGGDTDCIPARMCRGQDGCP